MKRDHDINNTDIERLLTGAIPSDSGADEDVQRFLAGLDRVVPVESTAHLEMAHLTAMIEATHDVVPTLPAPARNIPRRTALSTIFASRWSRIAGVSLAAVLAFGGTAYAGVLPAPIQNAVSAAMRPLGIVLPVASLKSLPARPGSSGTNGGASGFSGLQSRPTTSGVGDDASPSRETTAGSVGVGIGVGQPGTTVKPGAPASKAANKKRAARRAAAKRAAKKRAATKKPTVKPAPKRVTPPKKPRTTGDEAKHGKASGSPE